MSMPMPPRVIVSVLMLREGTDVNVCVIVPLRSSQAQILLEQTIGRGLRLMWRETDRAELKRDNRERLKVGQEPNNLIDVLTIIEHPAFQSFYDELMAEGPWPVSGEASDTTSSTGDLLSVGLRDAVRAIRFRHSVHPCARPSSGWNIGRWTWPACRRLPRWPAASWRRCWARAMCSPRRICKARRCLATIGWTAR